MASASSGGSSPSTPASVPASSYDYFYFTTTGQTYSAYQVANLFGIDPATASIASLNVREFYPIIATSPDFDTKLYNSTYVWTIVSITGGEGAERVYTAVPKPLPEAKENGSIELKQRANEDIAQIVTLSQLSNETLTSVASQDPLTRSPFLQSTLDEMDAVSVALGDNLAAVDAATTVDQIDSIIQGPYGTFVSGRGGAGPLDMQPSYFTVLENLPPGIGEPQLEIYIPGTDTVIPYDADLPEPYKFDSMGNCYAGTDFRTVIRVAATGQVLSTVRPPLGSAVPIEWTYNPNIPPAGGSSSSQK